MSSLKEPFSSTLVLGRYRIVRPLARGGMGIVYLARTEGAAGFARPVVIKSVLPDLMGNADAAQAFVREARILSHLQHPGIVNVLDFDEENGVYVMVLEYVHGYTLGQWQRYLQETDRVMPVEYAVYIMIRVLEALHYAHTFARPDGLTMQIVHRDVSPGNILLDIQGNVKLLDFGIARATVGDEYRTRDGTFKGKLTYSAPEIYASGPITPQSDVYSAGVVLYQMLCGKNPFFGRDMAEIVRRVLMEVPAPITSLRAEVPPALDAALACALMKDAEHRYPTAAAFAEALRALLPRREHEFFPELVACLGRDFNGGLPQALHIEALQTRDLAWRSAPEAVPPLVPLVSTAPPPKDPAAQIEKRTVAGHREARRALAEAASGLDAPTVPYAPHEVPRLEPAAPAPAPSSNRGLWLALAAVSAVAVFGAAVALRNRAASDGERSRFVYVEKNSLATAQPSAMPAASAPSPATTSGFLKLLESADAAFAPASSGGSPPAHPRSSSDAAALSRAFQSKRGRIEGCFSQYVSELAGRPEVSVRFRVSESGHVESAVLSPAALNGTPLGQCLVTVAASTNFGAQAQPITFTIPLRARRVQ